MALSSASLNIMLDGFADVASFVSLHTDSVGGGDANEVHGGSPVYARKPVAFSASNNGSMGLSGSVTFNVPASTTIRRVGLWTSATSGVFLGDAPIGQKTFASQGTYTLTSLTITLT